jgi:methylenetetrahydrofolate dehydrogenase (NADP+) / methenyltetrahydrofolate cyclohydrolase
MKIDGKIIASEILNSLKPQVDKLKEQNIIPALAIILIGNNESSKSYIKQKELKATEIGAKIELFHFEKINQDELLELINKLNNEQNIHGIIVQRPLPTNIDKQTISSAIYPQKDVDGFNKESAFDAPVAKAVIQILNQTAGNNFKSKNIVVIGKGETAGGPIIESLIKLGINPIVIDRQTQNPEELIKKADIIISAVGKENTVKLNLINTNQILIGVGLFSKDGILKGDYEVSEIENKVKFYTPTLGGVGPVNVAFLMQNLVNAATKLSSF